MFYSKTVVVDSGVNPECFPQTMAYGTSLSYVGGREGSAPVEQRARRQPDQAKPQGHLADHLSFYREKCPAPLEPGCPQPEPERSQDLHGS